MKIHFSFALILGIFTLNTPTFSFGLKATETNSISCKDQPGSKVWVWDGQNARLTSKGKKKLADLKKRITDKKKIKEYMTAADFEYYCCHILQEAPRCPTGCPAFSKQQYVAYSKVCNKPNYCPNVPGL